MFVHPQPSQSRCDIIIQAKCRVTVFEIGIPPKNFDHRSGRVVLPDLRHLQCSRLKFLPNMIIVSEPREKAYGIIPVARKLYLGLFHDIIVGGLVFCARDALCPVSWSAQVYYRNRLCDPSCFVHNSLSQ